jgi:PAS domain S-box-containing protein
MQNQTTSAGAIRPPFVLLDEADDSRLRALASYEIEALADDPELVAIVQFAARLCEAPIAQISFVERDRQRFLAGQGLDVRETSREVSFCAHAMRRGSLMEVRDATKEEQFAANPLVTGPPYIRYYAGQPLVSDEGEPLGALCIIDYAPRPAGLGELQRQGLAVLAQAVMRRLTGHRATLLASRDIAQREEQLRTLADSMPAIVWSADADGKFDYFNQGLLNFVGQTDGTGSAFHPDDWVRCDAAWKRSLATGEPYEVEHRMRHVDGGYRWLLARAIPMRDRDGRILRWFGTAVDIDDVHRLSEARDLLSRELAHRIKNIFAVVVGLVSLEARRMPEHRGFAEALTETLRALGRAHEFVRPAGGDTRESLKGLLEVLFAPYSAGRAGRVEVSGEDAAISARAATPLALVFHELATNSAKYGALSAAEGRVTLDITHQGDTLQLLWREHGGPPPPADLPAAQPGGDTGFGSRLVEMSVTGQLGGSWVRRFEAEGLVVDLTISRQAIAP